MTTWNETRRVRPLQRAALVVSCVVAMTANGTARQSAEVFVLGALGTLHEKTAGFDFETLDRIILKVGPEVMLLEVTPDELAGQLETKGRPEYPRVVWPMLRRAGALRAYAMEPCQSCPKDHDAHARHATSQTKGRL